MAKPANHQQHYNPNHAPNHPQLRQGEPWEHACNNGLILRGEFIEAVDGSEAPVLHFAHGNGLSCRLYGPFLAYLNQRFALFLHHAQGHGNSDKGDEVEHPFVGWNGTSARMVSAIQAQQSHGVLKGRRLIGTGHSFGGALTLLAAAKHPNLFESLVLFDGMMFPPLMAAGLAVSSFIGLNKHNNFSRQARSRGQRWDNIESAFQYFYKRGMLEHWHDDCVYSYLQHCLGEGANGEQHLVCPPWMEASIFAGRPAGLWKAIKSLNTPTQLFYGERSYPFIEPAVKRACKLRPNIQAQAIQGGHFFMLEDPSCLSQHPIWDELLLNRHAHTANT